MKTKVEILQGHQIGGCITIISTEQMKLVIDFGESLPGTDNVSNVDFDWQNENVSGVFFTHYHGDHIGRMEEIPEDIPIYMGEVTYKVMLNIYQALSRHDDNMAKKAEWLRNRKNVFFIQPDKEEHIGDMIVTPYSVDHSAFDSYMFLVHAYDEYILHTGDYRDHGHRGCVKGRNIPLAVIQKYITRYGRRKINMLITEGTTLTRSGLSRYTEKDMLHDADVFFRENKYVFLKISSTNVDSLASFAVAAQRNGMKMYVNGYLKAQIKIYQKASIKYNTKMYMFYNVEKLQPAPVKCKLEPDRIKAEQQRLRMRRNGFIIIASEKPSFQQTIDEFADLPVKTIYSMWRGYITPGSKAFNQELYDFCKATNAMEMHTSGHAYKDCIEKVIEVVAPSEEIRFIHTEAVNEFADLNICQELKNKVRWE